MSARLVVDSLRFALSGERLEGALKVASLRRLADLLAADSGMVDYRLVGSVDGRRPALRLNIEAVVELVCQRCLEAYSQPLVIDNLLPIARDEAELAGWERDDPLLDGLVAESAMDVAALVEDEILLSLPVAPRHPDGQCGQAGL